MMNTAQYWTDSAGVIAFEEPDLMNQKVWFSVESHGYLNENAPMGLNGVALDVRPGGSAVVPMRRINIAQRLYRFTGSGIFRDSILLGDTVPMVGEEGKPPIMGQDGGDAVVFGGRLHWLWGDTLIPSFPLGVFRGVGAVSDLPGNGGLDPDVGVALRYMRNEDGGFRPILNLPTGVGQVFWYSKPRVVGDGRGAEHLMTDYHGVKVDNGFQVVEWGLAEYSDKTGKFELVAKYPLKTGFLTPEADGTVVFRHEAGGREYFYHASPYPAIRYPTDYASQADFTTREAFTCLKQGKRFDGSAGQLDRDRRGSLRWAWKKDTSPITEGQMDRLVKSGAMEPRERWYAVKDVETGKPVGSHHGSIYWNAHRNRWVSVRLEHGGETKLGEVWYLEGDTPQGPWVYARKIITHAWKDHHCSFYATAQLPFFDSDNGRTIYLKGSFSSMFGDEKTGVPRHNYGIMMYKLDLDDSRLRLPVPVYHRDGPDELYGTKEAFPKPETDLDLVWFAPDRPTSGSVPVYQQDAAGGKGAMLTTAPLPGAKPAFYAVSAADASATTGTVPLHEFRHRKTGRRLYSTSRSLVDRQFIRVAQPVCRVWQNPILFNPYGSPEAGIW